jgi:hypothetical protein
MLIELIDRIVSHFEVVINKPEKASSRINPPICKEDDDAEMTPLLQGDFDIDYLDEIPF